MVRHEGADGRGESFEDRPMSRMPSEPAEAGSLTDTRDFALVNQVVTATVQLDNRRETWERALAVHGLLAVGVPEGVSVSIRWLKQAVRVQDARGELNFNDWVKLTEGHKVGRVATPGSGAQLGYAALAAMESFVSLLQKNVLNRRRWKTRDELRIAIVTWIERTYHRRRRQATLGRLTPMNTRPS